LAPEVAISIRDPRYGYEPSQVDMFNLGVILFVIMFQTVPFREASAEDPFYRFICEGDFYGYFNAFRANGFSLEIL
jgi:hypothetical protein